ncbi:MAG: L-aspartate oxidase [Solirubrobacterales bacterium]|nr:L-aspartate oxidase [Solirubrobacterales bacterium]
MNAAADACDLAVIGGGAAGLHVALEAAALEQRVCLISRKPLAESSSFWAQGGLAAALGDDDSPERHLTDTLAAGRGACRSEAVRILCDQAPAAVAKLEQRGVAFDRDADGSLALGLEGGHSARRIVHAGGSETGRRITSRLAELVAAEPLVDVREGSSALALWSDGERCCGVITDDGALAARATLLATGGAAALWSRTTNPWGSIGAGAVLAHAGGAALADLEFCQFHPTALAAPGGSGAGLLITEAIRGEGAQLLDASGQRFTDELAPRDAVSVAILDRMEADGADCVWLDMREIDGGSFPNVFAALRELGIDPSRELVPVAPAAHYAMGGIATDLEGRTTVQGLYAAGESACTGLHGANRLASNSLSECFVFGSRAARAAAAEPAASTTIAQPEWRFTPPGPATREAVWRHAGLRRSAEGLAPLLDDPYPLARMLAAAALERRESRGAHVRTDFPVTDPSLDGIHLVASGDAGPAHEAWR